MSQLANILTIRYRHWPLRWVPILNMNQQTRGQSKSGPRGTNLADTQQMIQSWIPFGALLAIATVIFQVGVYVGRAPIELLEERLESHESRDRHAGAVSETVVSNQLLLLRQEIASSREVLEVRLHALERKLGQRMNDQ